jgi:hypothetical protein
MSNTNTGGPAFPVLIVDRPKKLAHFNGMTLRDYFAAKAMQGFAMDDVLCKEAITAPDWYKSIADAAYDMADAMLAAREAA